MSSSTSNISRKETERTKLMQEKCQNLLIQMLRDEDNKYCVDCDAKGPRWASWNLGVFLCIRCAGIHRNLGVHISRVKSVNLDTWTPEQVISLQQMGNSRARAVYEAQLPDGFRRPQTDTALESFIRAKYEHKKYLAREWVPPSPPKVDWAKEIEEELEKQKRKKKAAQMNTALGIGVLSSGEKKLSASIAAKSAPLPAPLPKPKPGQSGSSPKTHRTSINATSSGSGGGAAAAVSVGGNPIDNNHSNDLLGLSSPTKPVQSITGNSELLHNDSFSGFLSATPTQTSNNNINIADSKTLDSGNSNNSLAKEEEDFFNQGSLVGIAGGDKDKSGKLTKDSILALYAAAPANPIIAQNNPHNPQMNFGHAQTLFGTTTPGTGGGGTVVGNGIFGGYMNPAGVPQTLPQQQQQQQQQHQFMTPPNSASMYNAPVMTAPTAFTSPIMSGSAGAASVAGMHGMQYPFQNSGFHPGGMPNSSLIPTGSAGISSIGVGGGIMPPMSMGNNLTAMTVMAQQQQQQQQAGRIGFGATTTTMPTQTAGFGVNFPAQSAATAAAASTANLNQQFGNLNIGNVWQ